MASHRRLTDWLDARIGDGPSTYNVPRDPSEETRQKRRRQLVLGAGFLGLLGAAILSPIVGALAVLGCMGGAVALGVTRGRTWCDGACPRGALLDRYLRAVSRRVDAPAWLASPFVRATVGAAMLSVLTVGLARQWGDPVAMVGVVARLLVVSTAIALVLGVAYHERAWCLVCPAGTFARMTNAIGRRLGIDRPTVQIDPEACVECGQCEQSCRPQLDPTAAGGDALATDGGTEPSASVDHGDCFRCGYCVETCPTDALELSEGSR
ncbi:4Fe-4S binding protein [Halorhabdus salina]|uniref:4Fe-4S binding protein n=1 Tax=Halorhabdus salina TaxID=2750670 RepID=UPI0015EF72EE|nr:4Fe-4S binding protein [Halorhabdus salina]